MSERTPVHVRIRTILQERGVPVATAERRMGRPLHWLDNRVSGKSPIKADELPDIAQFLGVPVQSLFEPTPAAQSNVVYQVMIPALLFTFRPDGGTIIVQSTTSEVTP